MARELIPHTAALQPLGLARQPDFRQAVALAYEAGAFAPKVVAKGKALLADEIIRRAREAGIFVHESRELVSLLMQVDLDQHIPPALYTAVAELLAWLYQLEQKNQMLNQPHPKK